MVLPCCDMLWRARCASKPQQCHPRNAWTLGCWKMLKPSERGWKPQKSAPTAPTAPTGSHISSQTLYISLQCTLFHPFSIFFWHWLPYWCSDPIYLRLPRVGRKEGSCLQFNTRTAAQRIHNAQRIHKKIYLISSYTLCFMHASYTFLYCVWYLPPSRVLSWP